jgi:hypothetical protein
LRERDGHAALCDQLDATARTVFAAGTHSHLATRRVQQAARLLRYLERRLQAMIKTDNAEAPATDASPIAASPAPVAESKTPLPLAAARDTAEPALEPTPKRDAAPISAASSPGETALAKGFTALRAAMAAARETPDPEVAKGPAPSPAPQDMAVSEPDDPAAELFEPEPGEDQPQSISVTGKTGTTDPHRPLRGAPGDPLAAVMALSEEEKIALCS